MVMSRIVVSLDPPRGDDAPETTGMSSSWTTHTVNQSVSGIADDCVILGVNASIPWDNARNLISQEVEHLTDRLKAAVFIPILYLFGAPANVVNMVVFFKQGLKERINFCLFSLALLDLIYLTLLFVFYAERVYTQFTDGGKYGPVYRYMMNHNVIGLYGFGYGPVLLSAIISTERCVCVLFPLRAQRCMPTKVLAIIIGVSLSVLVLLRFVITAQYRVTCFYEMATGRRSWQVYVTAYHFRNKEWLNALDGVFYGFCLSVGCPAIALVAAVVTAVRLQQTVRWRSHTSSNVSSAKETGVTKMLIALSVEFFVLSIPIIVLRVLPVFQPQLNAGGHYANAFLTLLGFAELCSYTSSSVNFFVYYFAGTKYRETLHGLIGRGTPFVKTVGQAKAVSVATVGR